MEEENFEQEILNKFLQGDLNSLSYQKQLSETDYNSSNYRKEKYKNMPENDKEFADYIKRTYGSVSSFFDFRQDLIQDKLYDPSSDYLAEVVVITDEEYYKSGFISPTEVFFEILKGIATIEYFKMDGRAAKIVGTLEEGLRPSSQQNTRANAFSFIGSRRILVWDLQKQGWSSFYMSNLRRFIKDDTYGLE
jgi:hypothetical protein